jgi:eight-cysteine-cluster-containing protein
MRIAPSCIALVVAFGSCACPGKGPSEAVPGGGAGGEPAASAGSGASPGTPAAGTGTSPGTPGAGSAAAGSGAAGGGGGDRTPAVPADNPLHDRVEGVSLQNGCTGDAQCFVGGCSGEMCTAEEGATSTCEAPAGGWPIQGAQCGCVQGQCIWYRAAASSPTPSPAPTPAPTPAPSASLPGQGQTCGAGDACQTGLTCVKFYGIAGARGPQLSSCEIRCAGGAPCPAGQACITIADGPGQVCRPKR